MRNTHFRLAAAAIVAIFLAACSSTGGLGDIFGGGSNTYPTTQAANLSGTVNSVDTRNSRINITVNDYSNAQRYATVYYDSRTRVNYQNQSGSPSQLENGDRVDIQGYNDTNGQFVANTITVTQSMSSSYPGTYPSSSSNLRTMQGTVNFVDTTAQRIDLSLSYINGLRNTQNSNYSIYYDARTRVMYQGRQYSPTDLERGDQVDISVLDNGNSRYLADTITVTRNVRQ